MHRGITILSHLLSVNFYFLFCRTIDKEADVLKNILTTFEASSGLVVNLRKSEICFSRNTSQIARDSIFFHLGMSIWICHL